MIQPELLERLGPAENYWIATRDDFDPDHPIGLIYDHRQGITWGIEDDRLASEIVAHLLQSGAIRMTTKEFREKRAERESTSDRNVK